MNATRLLGLVAALCGAALLLFWFLQRGERVDPLALDDAPRGAAEPAPAEPTAALPASAAAGEGAAPGPAAAPGAATRAAREAVDPDAERRSGPRWSGRVRDEFGRPLAGAEVSVGAPPSTGALAAQARPRAIDATGTTADDGRFALVRKKKRDAPWVEVRARGYRVFGERVEVEAGAGDRDLGDLLLEPGAILLGQVVDDGGLPVAGVTVEREVETSAMAELIASAVAAQGRGTEPELPETDADGRFELANEEPGAFALVVRHELYPETRVEGEVQVGETCSLFVRFPPTASITGRAVGFPAGRTGVKLAARLLERLDGEAPARAELAELLGAESPGAFGRVAEVGPDGSFALHGLLPERRYELVGSRTLGFMQSERCTERVEVASGTDEVELAYDAGATVELRLVAAGTGEPLSDPEVRHSWIGEAEARAVLAAMGAAKKPRVEADGTVALEELRPPADPGRLRLVVGARGYHVHEVEEVLVKDGERVHLGTIALKPAARVRVRVVDARTAEPVPKARVRLSEDRLDYLAAAMQAGRDPEGAEAFDPEEYDALRPPRHEKGRTDSEGWCELPGFAAGAAVLQVQAAGYAALRRDGLTLMADGVQIEHVQLHAGGIVAVRVVDAFGRPVPRARVQRRDAEAEGAPTGSSKKTDAKGVARFTKLAPGDHAFRIAPEKEDVLGGALRRAIEGEDEDEDASGWSRVAVGAGTEQVLVLQLEARGRLEGRVSAAGRPLGGARVSLHPAREEAENDEAAALRELQEQLAGSTGGSPWSDETDSEGHYEIAEVPAGRFELRVTHPDRPLAHLEELELGEGFNERDLELPETALEGRVLDPRGQPVAGAQVRVYRASDLRGEVLEVRAFFQDTGLGGRGGSGGARTNALGVFTLRGLPAGTELVVEASHADFAPGRCAPVELRPDELRTDVDVELGPAGRLRVTAPAGQVGFAFVSATYLAEEGEPPVASRSGVVRGGRALLRGLRPGRWKVVLGGSTGAQYPAQTVNVRAGETSSVAFSD